VIRILIPMELDFTFGGSYVCVNYGENRSRNATVRVLADGYTDSYECVEHLVVCSALWVCRD